MDKSKFDPLAEAKRVFAQLGLDQLATEAYVFGSAANGNFTESSDIDILVVFDSKETLSSAKEILKRKPISEWPFDWIFKMRADFEKRSEIGGVCFIAKKQGVRIK